MALFMLGSAIVSSDDSIASASLSESTVVVTGISDGRATVTITDSDNESIDAQISVIEALIPIGNIVAQDLKIGAIINFKKGGKNESKMCCILYGISTGVYLDRR